MQNHACPPPVLKVSSFPTMNPSKAMPFLRRLLSIMLISNMPLGVQAAESATGRSWHAEWIGPDALPQSGPAISESNAWTCFRKKFTLVEMPAKATAHIAVDSKYWLWVNGKLAVYEGGLKRGPNPQRHLLRCRGPRAVFAGGRQHHRGARVVLGQRRILAQEQRQGGFRLGIGCGRTRIVSDETWKSAPPSGLRHHRRTAPEFPHAR